MLYDAFLVSDKPVERQITLPDGSVHAVYLRPVGLDDFRKFQLAERQDDLDVRAKSVAKLLSLSLCDAEGGSTITPEQAGKIAPKLADELAAMVLDMNSFGADAKKLSPAEA